MGKNLLSSVAIIALVVAASFWVGTEYQKGKDLAAFKAKPAVHFKDTTWLPRPAVQVKPVASTIEYIHDTTLVGDTLHFVARGDTVAFSDSAKIAPTYYYPDNRFELAYFPPPPMVIRDSVYVPPIIIEMGPTFWEKVEYIAIGGAAVLILKETVFDGNR